MPTPAEARRLDHAEIARRYRRKRKRWPRPTIAELRVKDLDRFFAHRYGDQLPDDDAGRGDILVMAHHLAALPGSAETSITGWIRQHAPWYPTGDLADLLLEVSLNPQRWRADRLAWEIGLKEKDRAKLGITTIGAIDLGKAARIARRRSLKNAAREQARRLKGSKPRADYEAAALTRLKPWLAMGISRATWYRRKPAP